MSTSLALLLIFMLVVGGCAVFAAFVKSHHFFRCAFFSIFTGTGSLLLVHFTSLMTNFSLPINLVSLLVGAFGGLPGVLAMAIIKLI